MPQENPTHLFISYATEDGALADWLARKLANQGYAVWLDRLKMLGGAPWSQSIAIAITEPHGFTVEIEGGRNGWPEHQVGRHVAVVFEAGGGNFLAGRFDGVPQVDPVVHPIRRDVAGEAEIRGGPGR